MTKPLNSTIEIDFNGAELANWALVLHGWFSPARADMADGSYRCMSPDGVCWHVLSFGGDCGEETARRLVHSVFDGQEKRIGLGAENCKPLTN